MYSKKFFQARSVFREQGRCEAHIDDRSQRRPECRGRAAHRDEPKTVGKLEAEPLATQEIKSFFDQHESTAVSIGTGKRGVRECRTEPHRRVEAHCPRHGWQGGCSHLAEWLLSDTCRSQPLAQAVLKSLRSHDEDVLPGRLALAFYAE